MTANQKLNAYFGDLHNHLNIGYGHGTIDDAIRNAQLQLDFVCLTPHAVWPDIPGRSKQLAEVVDYHVQGFEKTTQGWELVKQKLSAANQPGQFVTFLGFEWHSLEYGDHNIVFDGDQGEIVREPGLIEMRHELRALSNKGIESILIPHHIGYKQGYRGINWDTFTPEYSPVVEIMSMHGCSESEEAPYAYLHTMGPRDVCSLYQYGLALGHVVGVIGSTDHHSAHPGSYGHGRVCVWAPELTRAGIFKAIQSRRTVALTGDNIALVFTLNGESIGSVLQPVKQHIVQASVTGGDAIDYVELLKNNRVVQRWNLNTSPERWQWDPKHENVKMNFEVGWGKRSENVDWDVDIEIQDGNLVAVEPHFRGHENVAPTDAEETAYHFSEWQQLSANHVSFSTRTWGNMTTTTSSTQGICLELHGTPETTVKVKVNGKSDTVKLSELLSGSKAGYLGGFLTPAYYFHRAIPEKVYTWNLDWQDNSAREVNAADRDWYYVRVRQHNNQYAWSSPIWVERE